MTGHAAATRAQGPNRHRSLFEPRRLDAGAVFPGLVAVRNYQKAWLRGDLLAGVTVAAYAIPQVMAYAQIAGLPPAYGLIGILGPALAYFVFGGSHRLSVGPESTTALMTASAIAAALGPGVATQDPSRYAALVALLAVVVGVVCLVAWACGLGFLADLLSKPVLVGYMAGAAVLMIVSQIKKISGISTSGESLPEQVVSAVRNSHQVHWPTVAMSAAVLIGMLIAARFAPRAPSALIAVLLATGATAVFGLQRYGIATIGAIPAGLPVPTLPVWDAQLLRDLLIPALGVAVVGYSDNVLTGRAFHHDQDPPVEANQELMALGAANLGAGVFGGFPVSSSGSRTALAAMVGARTQVFMLVCAATVLAAVLFLGPMLALFPTAALGGIVVYAATRLIEVGEIRRIARYRRSELILGVATTVGVFFLGVLSGIGLAVALSLGDLLRRVARPHDAILGYVPGLGGMHDIEDHHDARQVPGLVVYRYDSPLFFANAEDFRERALVAVESASPPARWLVLNAEANVQTDITSLDSLQELVKTLKEREVTVALTRVKDELRRDLMDHGVGEVIGADRMFPTLPEAVRGYLTWYQEQFGRLPEGVESLPVQSLPVRLDES